MSSAYNAAKNMLALAPLRSSNALEFIVQFLKFGEYIRTSGVRSCPSFPDKYAMYEYIQTNIIGDEPIDYLEFGVCTGTSLRRWVDINRNERSRFFGFDTFEGLPEVWNQFTGSLRIGHFSTNGELPAIDDSRVEFIKGLFQDTLKGFIDRCPPVNRLLIHVDADLYSAALYVLSTLHPFMKTGSLVLFDEFASVNSEFRAFCDYSKSFYKRFAPVSRAGGFYEQVAMQVA